MLEVNLLNKDSLFKWGAIFVSFGLSLIIALVFPQMNFSNIVASATNDIKETSIIKQEVLGVLNEPIEVIKVYDSGELIGIVHDYQKVENLLDTVYHESYEEAFPDTYMGLGEDIYITKELSSFEYENKDDEICTYLKENDQFAIETYSIEFSDDTDVYKTIYVQNIEDYNNAQTRYLKNFISSSTLDLIANNQTIPELKTYGRRELSVDILENITVSKALASPSKIMTSEEEIFSFLCYGDDPTPEIYVVEEYDTVAGVGSKNNGLSAEQVVTINAGVLNNVDQVLEAGMELNVRYFDSPINVVVKQELITKEIVYPGETEYRENSSLREGLTKTVRDEQNGSKNVKYEETWINGVLVSGTEISSIITQQPVNAIIEYGTKIIPGVGSGSFRWPCYNPVITCKWGCYAGHRAIDIKNSYNRYGDVLAADRGTVIENSYHYINGYYMVIDHNNGYTSYYGHMNKRGFYPVGTNVEKGEVIGQIGMTGQASGPHIHFFITKNGVRVNPIYYLP